MTNRKLLPLMHELVDEQEYRSDDGHTIKREQGLTPNGNPLNGRWVLRDPEGKFIDFNQYRHDLIEHNGFRTAY